MGGHYSTGITHRVLVAGMAEWVEQCFWRIFTFPPQIPNTKSVVTYGILIAACQKLSVCVVSEYSPECRSLRSILYTRTNRTRTKKTQQSSIHFTREYSHDTTTVFWRKLKFGTHACGPAASRRFPPVDIRLFWSVPTMPCCLPLHTNVDLDERL